MAGLDVAFFIVSVYFSAMAAFVILFTSIYIFSKKGKKRWRWAAIFLSGLMYVLLDYENDPSFGPLDAFLDSLTAGYLWILLVPASTVYLLAATALRKRRRRAEIKRAIKEEEEQNFTSEVDFESQEASWVRCECQHCGEVKTSGISPPPGWKLTGSHPRTFACEECAKKTFLGEASPDTEVTPDLDGYEIASVVDGNAIKEEPATNLSKCDYCGKSEASSSSTPPGWEEIYTSTGMEWMGFGLVQTLACKECAKSK